MKKEVIENREVKKKVIPQNEENVLSIILDIVVSIYVLVMLAVLPLYFQDGFTHIGSDKSYFFRQVSFRAVIIMYALLAIYGFNLWFTDKKKKKVSNTGFNFKEDILNRLSATDKFAIIYGIGVIISYLCSNYKNQVVLGAEKWYMGTLPQLTMVSVYFFVSRFFKKHTWILMSLIPVSAVTFILGVLNRFGIFPIDMQVENPYFISTVGNINWYCGYLVTVFFTGVGYYLFADFNNKICRMSMILYVILGFAALVTQGSDSGIFTLGVMLVLMFVMAGREKKLVCTYAGILIMFSGACLIVNILQLMGLKLILPEPNKFIEILTMGWVPPVLLLMSCIFGGTVLLLIKKNIFSEKISKNLGYTALVLLLLISAAAVGLIVINTLREGTLVEGLGLPKENLFYFSSNWGSGRSISWAAAVYCFAEQNLIHKIVGVGPDGMAAYLYGDAGESILLLVKGRFGTQRLTNAHNEWLTILLNQGIVGMVSFAGMICSAIYRYIKGKKISPIAGACGLGVLAYTLNNIFSFQTSINMPTMFIILGLGECYLRNKKYPFHK